MLNSAPLVFNCSSGNSKKITMTKDKDQQESILMKEIPYKDMIWTNNCVCTSNYTLFYILTILWHILPALLMDLILKYFKRQRM